MAPGMTPEQLAGQIEHHFSLAREARELGFYSPIVSSHFEITLDNLVKDAYGVPSNSENSGMLSASDLQYQIEQEKERRRQHPQVHRLSPNPPPPFAVQNRPFEIVQPPSHAAQHNEDVLKRQEQRRSKKDNGTSPRILDPHLFGFDAFYCNFLPLLSTRDRESLVEVFPNVRAAIRRSEIVWRPKQGFVAKSFNTDGVREFKLDDQTWPAFKESLPSFSVIFEGQGQGGCSEHDDAEEQQQPVAELQRIELLTAVQELRAQTPSKICRMVFLRVKEINVTVLSTILREYAVAEEGILNRAIKHVELNECHHFSLTNIHTIGVSSLCPIVTVRPALPYIFEGSLSLVPQAPVIFSILCTWRDEITGVLQDRDANQEYFYMSGGFNFLPNSVRNAFRTSTFGEQTTIAHNGQHKCQSLLMDQIQRNPYFLEEIQSAISGPCSALDHIGVRPGWTEDCVHRLIMYRYDTDIGRSAATAINNWLKGRYGPRYFKNDKMDEVYFCHHTEHRRILPGTYFSKVKIERYRKRHTLPICWACQARDETQTQTPGEVGPWYDPKKTLHETLQEIDRSPFDGMCPQALRLLPCKPTCGLGKPAVGLLTDPAILAWYSKYVFSDSPEKQVTCPDWTFNGHCSDANCSKAHNRRRERWHSWNSAQSHMDSLE